MHLADLAPCRGLVRLRHFTTVVGLVGAVLASPLAALAASPSQPSELARYFGDASSATGAALAHGACDVNGDGYDDVIAGAWFWDKTGIADNTGAAYVLLGGEAVTGGDLSNPAAANAVRIEGAPVAGQFLGFSVGCAGDVNGDDYDDILIGDYISEQAYVLFGASDFGPLDLGNLGTHGYRIRLDDTEISWNFGFAVTGVGDLNDDGLDDVAVAAVVADTLGRTNNGRIYVLAGKQDTGDIVLPTDGSSTSVPLIILDGSTEEERLGSMSLAGDVDGDGVPDFVVGSYASTPHGSSVAAPGAAWVIAGLARGSLDLATPGDLGLAIWGPTRGRDRLGISVASAGDQNGDGYDDVLIGGDGVYNAATGRRPGSAWVVYGGESIFTELDVVHTDTDPSATHAVYSEEPGATPSDPTVKVPRGYWIVGAISHSGTGGESFGYSLDGITDVNGDGTPDLLIGAYGHRTGDPSSPVTTGATWVLYGRGGYETLDLSSFTPSDGYRIDGLASGDRFGRQVGFVGDVDGNGVPDFAVGGDFSKRPLNDPSGRTQSGEVTIALLPDPPGLPEAAEIVAGAAGATSFDLTCPDAFYECVGDLELIAGSAYQVRTTFDLESGEKATFPFTLTSALQEYLTQNGSAPGTLRLRGTGHAGEELDEETSVTISLPGWRRFGLPKAAPPTTTVNKIGTVRLVLGCAETYDKCKGTASLKLGGKWTPVLRYSIRSGQTQLRKFKLEPSVLAKLARDGFLVGTLKVDGVIGGTAATARETVVVKAHP